jgi:hypothetical protein
MQGTHGHLSTEQKRTAFRLRKEGWRLIDIAQEVGCTAAMGAALVKTVLTGDLGNIFESDELDPHERSAAEFRGPQQATQRRRSARRATRRSS